MGRRSRTEILIDLLRAIEENDPIKPTKLMYASNTGWALLKEMTAALEEAKYIVKVEYSKRDERTLFLWSLTGEGKKVLRHGLTTIRMLEKLL